MAINYRQFQINFPLMERYYRQGTLLKVVLLGSGQRWSEDGQEELPIGLTTRHATPQHDAAHRVSVI